jgi:membrane associated rhomboid family serine protease
LPTVCYHAATAVLPQSGSIGNGARWVPEGEVFAATEGEARELEEDAAQAAAVVLSDGTVTLGAQRLKAVLLLTFCLLVTGVFVTGVIAGSTVGAGIGVVVFGALSVLCALRLLRSRVHLRFGPDGLAIRSNFRTRRWAWNDVESFQAFEIHHQYNSTKHVGFDLRRLTPERQSFWQTANRGVSGVDVTLPDGYGLDYRDLAYLLALARDRWATEHGPSPSALADLELERAAERVRQDRLPLVTAALAIGCLVVYVMQTSRHGVFPEPLELQDFGAVSRDTLADGQWWTLFTAALLHANPIHLVLNLVGLGLFGLLLEREIGWPRLAVLAVSSAAVSSACSVLIHPSGVTVGVSGLIFALVGWALVRDKHRTRALGAIAWPSIVVGLVYTFFTPGTSIGGHLGGLIAGVVLARLLDPRDLLRRPHPSTPVEACGAPTGFDSGEPRWRR